MLILGNMLSMGLSFVRPEAVPWEKEKPPFVTNLWHGFGSWRIKFCLDLPTEGGCNQPWCLRLAHWGQLPTTEAAFRRPPSPSLLLLVHSNTLQSPPAEFPCSTLRWCALPPGHFVQILQGCSHQVSHNRCRFLEVPALGQHHCPGSTFGVGGVSQTLDPHRDPRLYVMWKVWHWMNLQKKKTLLGGHFQFLRALLFEVEYYHHIHDHL